MVAGCQACPDSKRDRRRALHLPRFRPNGIRYLGNADVACVLRRKVLDDQALGNRVDALGHDCHVQPRSAAAVRLKLEADLRGRRREEVLIGSALP